MRMHHVTAALVILATIAPTTPTIARRHAASLPKTVETYGGRVDASNASAFADMLSENLDEVIGLRIAIAPNREGEKYSVSRDSRGYTIVGNQEFEAVFQGGQGRRGRDETIEGYFKVLNGGMHQGILSYGLKPIPKTTMGDKAGLVVIPRTFEPHR
jgi:hypothetical protein